jgi:GT2 family glycosyltransferase
MTARIPRLGIAIVHYHAEHLLQRCLACLRASEVDDFRACILDCGSREGLERYVRGDDRFQVVSPGRNIGFAAGSNRAFAQMAEPVPFLLSLNPDVFVEPDTIGHMIQELEQCPEVGAVSCALRLPSGALDPACRRSDPTLFSAFSKHVGLQRCFPRSRLFGRYNLTYLDADQPHEVDSGTGGCLLIRREAWQAAGGGFDERFFLYGEDLDLCRRIRQAGYRIRYIPWARATHVKGSGRIRAFPTTVQFFKAMWTYYRKWGRHRNNPIVLALLAAGLMVLTAWESVHNAGKALRQKLTGTQG